jgi:protoheme IX farnesyltransferase
VAVSGQLDLAALLLFIILLCWQMPHFYAIALYRLNDYKAAGIPVVPAFKGLNYTRNSILIWIIVWTMAVLLLTIYNYTGITYCIVVGLAGLFWLGYGWHHKQVTEAWAKRMFAMSLFAVSIFCLMASISSLLP